MADSEAAEEAVVLRYTAKDDYFIGVPARDLTADDLSRVAGSGRWGKTRPTVIKRLTETSLYTEAASESAADGKADEKEA